MLTLGPRTSFWTAAAVAGLALWGSGAPTVIYPLYAHEWGLSAGDTSAIFAIYPIVLILVLILFGNLSDAKGRRFTILLGLAAMAVGSVIFGLAPDLIAVFVGRALMGVGVGLSLSPATAAMVEFGGPTGAARASSTTTASTATGLALATLVGGALVEYAPAPLHLTFWVLFGVVVVVGCAAWFLPRHTRDDSAPRWRPRPLSVPRGLRMAVAAGALGISSAFALGAVYLALGALIASDLVHSDNAFVNGAVLAICAAVIGIVAILARRLAPRKALLFGPMATLIGLGLMVESGVAHSLFLFVLASVAGGAGYSLLFSGGLGVLTAAAPAHHRAGVISSAYVVGYLAQAIAALGLGALATAHGLELAIVVGAPIIVLIGVAALIVSRFGIFGFREHAESSMMTVTRT